MKSLLKIIAVGSAFALGSAALPAKSYAGDREWATVGKVLTGVAAVGVLSAIIHDAHHPRVGVSVEVGHCPPPPPRWNSGHYETRQERVCIPGYWTTVTEPAVYRYERRGCHTVQILVRPPCTRRVWVPERYEIRETRVWVPGRYDDRYAYNR
ncbi:MAG: hypothetical protein PCFJNLEI_02526 [Verrucomicrobiae bacterium]|nr:hypothetical protein [Verrucomicrobiae bacterium]